jgi:hypothetical protein
MKIPDEAKAVGKGRWRRARRIQREIVITATAIDIEALCASAEERSSGVDLITMTWSPMTKEECDVSTASTCGWPHRGPNERGLAVLFHTVDREDVLGKIDSDEYYLHRLFLQCGHLRGKSL